MLNKPWPDWVRTDGIDTLESMGFYNSNYGNDACPSWMNDKLDLQVFVDVPIGYSEVTNDPEHYSQYVVIRASRYGESEGALLATNDFNEVVNLTNTIMEKHEK